MRTTLDFAPLLRSSIGFENLNRLVDFTRGESDSYPPYNIEKTGDGYFYAGRSFQEPRIFALEEKLHAHLNRDKFFLHRDDKGTLCVIGEGVTADMGTIQAVAPEVQRSFDVTLTVDRRHRARIDRAHALGKAEKWLAG